MEIQGRVKDTPVHVLFLSFYTHKILRLIRGWGQGASKEVKSATTPAFHSYPCCRTPLAQEALGDRLQLQ